MIKIASIQTLITSITGASWYSQGAYALEQYSPVSFDTRTEGWVGAVAESSHPRPCPRCTAMCQCARGQCLARRALQVTLDGACHLFHPRDRLVCRGVTPACCAAVSAGQLAGRVTVVTSKVTWLLRMRIVDS
jgi:hypothetical protein